MKKISIVLLLVLLSGCFCSVKEEPEKKQEEVIQPVTCTDYVEDYLSDEGWTRTGEVIFTNDDDNYLVWNISSNVFIFMDDEANIELFINNDQIFVGNDYETDRFDDLRIEIDYDSYKDFATTTYDHFDELGCPLRGKENNILTEEYKEVYIER